MKINNINTKLLAGLTAFTMLTTSLTGCAEPLEPFTYETLEDGAIECTGRISYGELKSLEVVELTVFNKKELYIVKDKVDYWSGRVSRVDIATNITIFDPEKENKNKSLEIICKVEDYLLYYDLIKDSYSAEEVENLLIKIKEDRELEKDKTLVKDK